MTVSEKNFECYTKYNSSKANDRALGVLCALARFAEEVCELALRG